MPEQGDTKKAIHANPLGCHSTGIDDAISFTEDHTVGLSSFTIMAGLGGSLGYAMGAFNWGSFGEFFEKTRQSTLPTL